MEKSTIVLVPIHGHRYIERSSAWFAGHPAVYVDAGPEPWTGQLPAGHTYVHQPVGDGGFRFPDLTAHVGNAQRVAFCADDDFLAHELLDMPGSFVSGHVAQWAEGAPVFAPTWADADRRSLLHPDPRRRVSSLARRFFDLLYGVHEAGSFRRAFTAAQSGGFDNAHYWELAFSVVAAWNGPVTIRPEVLSAREIASRSRHRTPEIGGSSDDERYVSAVDAACAPGVGAETLAAYGRFQSRGRVAPKIRRTLNARRFDGGEFLERVRGVLDQPTP